MMALLPILSPYFAEGGIVSDFVTLLAEGDLVQIIDPQVIEEAKNQSKSDAVAASRVNIRGEERPTMKQVEHIYTRSPLGYQEV